MTQLHPQYCGLQSIKSTIVSRKHVLVLFFLAIVAKHFDSLCHLCVIGDDHPGIAVGSQVLSWIKTEASCVSQTTNPLSFVTCPVGLAGIFYDEKIPGLCNLQNLVHLGGLAV